jgi:hypothetical protein
MQGYSGGLYLHIISVWMGCPFVYYEGHEWSPLFTHYIRKEGVSLFVYYARQVWRPLLIHVRKEGVSLFVYYAGQNNLT